MSTAAASGNGAANAVTFISGTQATKLLWPDDSIPASFTVCSATRYAGAERGGILSCTGSPTQALTWVHGHDVSGDSDSKRGIAYYHTKYTTSALTTGVKDDWLVMCGTNAGAPQTVPGNMILDQDEIGTEVGGEGGGRLNIGYDHPSDWALHSLLIWDYALGTVPALWHTSATLSQVLLTWFLWCDLGMRGTVFSGQGDWGRRYS